VLNFVIQVNPMSLPTIQAFWMLPQAVGIVSASKAMALSSLGGEWILEAGSTGAPPYYVYTGQCDVPEPNTGLWLLPQAISIVSASKGDGSIVAWGRNNYGQCNVPSPIRDLLLFAGDYHCLGLQRRRALS